MKRKLSVLFILVFLSSGVFAQGFRIGLKGGVNMGKLDGKAFKDQFSMGYQIGGFVTIPIVGKLAIQPEVLFNQTNLDSSDHFSEIYEFNNIGSVDLNYLSIPIMLNFNLNRYLTLQAGPQFGVVINQDKNLLKNGEDAFKTGDFALAAGLQINLSNFRVYGRFTGGMTNLDNVGSKENWKTQTISLGVGFTL